jgi:hypothetical protein
MKNSNIYSGYRYPAQIFNHSVWLCNCFTSFFKYIEELLTLRGFVYIIQTTSNEETRVILNSTLANYPKINEYTNIKRINSSIASNIGYFDKIG